MRQLLTALALVLASCDGRLAEPPVVRIANLDVQLTGRVVDRADILPAGAENALSTQSAALEAATTDQLVVVTVPGLGGRTIEDVGLRLGRAWKIGRADLDNGVLIIVAPNEKKVRIEVGYGLEGLLTDQRAAQIITLMLPQFRRGDMSAAIQTGANEIAALLLSDRRRPRYRSVERKRAA